MAAEIIAAVAAANSAFNFIRSSVQKGREMQDLTRAIGKFWDAREEISVIEQQATNPSKIAKLFGGRSVEAQALEITLQKQKAEQLERDLKNIFLWTGNGHLWENMVRERTRIRNARIAAAREKPQAKAAMIDFFIIGGTLLLCGFIVLSATSIILPE